MLCRSVAGGSSYYTVSVRVDPPRTPDSNSLILFLEGCGLTPADVLEASVSVSALVTRGDDDSEGWVGTTNESGSFTGEGSSLEPRGVGGYVVGKLNWLLPEQRPFQEAGADRELLALGGAAEVLAERIGAAQAQQQRPPREQSLKGRRKLAEDCSAACLTHDTQRCYNDPDCEQGGLGCNALHDPLCRFCGFDAFGECPELPTASPAATPAPTVPSNRQECTASCLTAEFFVCYDDPSCSAGGLGCNARGDFYCRFCGFGDFDECPFTPTPATPAPVMAPTSAPMVVTLNPVAQTTAPSTVAPTPVLTFAPVIAATIAPSIAPVTPSPVAVTFAPSLAAATARPVAVTSAPSVAPATLVPVAVTAAPSAAATTASLDTAAPSAAPTPSRDVVIPPNVGATAAPSIAPTALQSAAPTAGLTSAATGEFLLGTLSATGVSDALIADKGRDVLVQEVRGACG